MKSEAFHRRIAAWWDESGRYGYAMIALAICLTAIPLAMYGAYAFLKIGWLLTFVFLANTVLAMMMLSYAAPMASTASLFVATLLWLYNASQLLLLCSAALYGGFVLLTK